MKNFSDINERRGGVLEILFNDEMENYKGNKEERKALEQIEELRLKFIKKYGDVMFKLFDELDDLYFDYAFANMRDLFFLGFTKGFLLAGEIAAINIEH